MIATKKTGKEGSKSQKTIHMDNLCTLKFYRNIILGVTVRLYDSFSLYFRSVAYYFSTPLLKSCLVFAVVISMHRTAEYFYASKSYNVTLYFLVTYFFFWDRFTARYIVLSSLCLIANFSAYQFMSYLATPRYENDERGNSRLVDAGFDLNIGSGSLSEHAKDLILTCSLVQGLALLHNGFWLLLFFIPGRVCYLFWVHILAPWIFDPNQSPQISEKKQKKQERRLKRMQNAGR
ncbi:unnamed protein product [Taenia asiatica]|uniref:Transmembrane protein 208 n=1 Tax=Taenia asiatica TaxID=60517 RepID=A0A0R3W371_TAEAS|nr:unnamed protein product [Taenia asiatica]